MQLPMLPPPPRLSSMEKIEMLMCTIGFKGVLAYYNLIKIVTFLSNKDTLIFLYPI